MKTRQTFDFPLPRLAPSTQKNENLYKEKKKTIRVKCRPVKCLLKFWLFVFERLIMSSRNALKN